MPPYAFAQDVQAFLRTLEVPEYALRALKVCLVMVKAGMLRMLISVAWSQGLHAVRVIGSHAAHTLLHEACTVIFVLHVNLLPAHMPM